MRTESCKKCGHDLQKYDKCGACDVCKEDIVQNFCPHCQIVTDPQHHRHNSTSVYATVVCGLLNFSYITQETSLVVT
ncbi:MAG: hypothetical protein EPO62_04745 [Candidatus Nitrosotenuis sp.]|nr:MAG: hypothetical protein EPO62_04745 [Candidatus Nitrosotenuis sp.]